MRFISGSLVVLVVVGTRRSIFGGFWGVVEVEFRLWRFIMVSTSLIFL